MQTLEYLNAELALMSYSNLEEGKPTKDVLVKGDVDAFRADFLIKDWVVIDQYQSSISGLSATIFQGTDKNSRYLAIRGTDGFTDLVTDALSIIALGTKDFQLQYRQLASQVNTWINDGTLPQAFTVTGHSLGGFLATGLLSDFSSHITHAYLFNSPGVGGVSLGGVPIAAAAALIRLIGGSSSVDLSKVSNLKAEAGISPISGMGIQVAPPESIFIEDQLDLAVVNRPRALNHSQRVIADSLAIYSAFRSLDSSVSLKDIGLILKRSGNANASSLESALDRLLRLFGSTDRTAFENRDSYYANLQSLDGLIDAKHFDQSPRIRSLNGSAADIASASVESESGLAYRFALSRLDPFVMLAPAEFYDSVNRIGNLELYDQAARTGVLTAAWIRDRATFLRWQNQKNDRDIPDGTPLADENQNSYVYSDEILGSVAVAGSEESGRAHPIRIRFGGSAEDTLVGGVKADHLYGAFGNDTLRGSKGNDYLEGGGGVDTYEYESIDGEGGVDTILDVDGQGVLKFDGVVVRGGAGVSAGRYESEDGAFNFALVKTGSNTSSLIVNDAVRIENFRNGDLGILLQEANGSESVVVEYQYHYRGSEYPDDGPREGAFRSGSAFNDEYLAGSRNGDSFLEGWDSGYFYGRGGDDRFLGSALLGADQAFGGAGNDYLDGGALGGGTQGPVDSSRGRLVGGSGQDIVKGGQHGEVLFGDMSPPYALHRDMTDGDLSISINESSIHFLDQGHYFVAQGPEINNSGDPRQFDTLDQALYFALGIPNDSILGDLYDDQVDGMGGDDEMVGGPGSDSLYGGAGNDVILGDDEASTYRQILGVDDTFGQAGFGPYAYLLGLPGDDYIDGGEGDDTLKDIHGGNDTLIGGAGNDELFDGNFVLDELFYKDEQAPRRLSASNFLDGGEGDDRISLVNNLSGEDFIDGGAGNDVISADGSELTIDGGDGNDSIDATASLSAIIDGGSGNDEISVLAAYAEIAPGAGNDHVWFGGGLAIIDPGGNGETDYDVISFSWPMEGTVVAREGDDLILFNAGTVVFTNWFEGAANQFDSIEFGDEVSWTPSDVQAWLDRPIVRDPAAGRELAASPESPVVLAGNGDDSISAEAETVCVSGGGGDDLMVLEISRLGFIAGGPGSDDLTIQTGSVVGFNRGDGADTLTMPGGTLSFGGGLTLADLSISETGDNVLFDFGNGDSILMPGQSIDALEEAGLRLQFVSLRQVEVSDLGSLGQSPDSLADSAYGGWLAYTYGNGAGLGGLPEGLVRSVLDEPAFGEAPQQVPGMDGLAPFNLDDIADQSATVGRLYSLAVDDRQFVDLDSDAPLSLSVASTDGPLPEWLHFNSTNGTLFGIPLTSDEGRFDLELVATDSEGFMVADAFTITVQAAGEPVTDQGDEVGVVSPPGSDSPQGGASIELPVVAEPALFAPLPFSGVDASVTDRQVSAIDSGFQQPVLPTDALESLLSSDGGAVPWQESAGMELVSQTPIATAASRVLETLDLSPSPATPPPGPVAVPAAMLLADHPTGQDSEQTASDGDGGFASGDAGQSSSQIGFIGSAQPAAPANERSAGLSHWEIANALLQFHLERHSDDAQEGMAGPNFSNSLSALQFQGASPLTELQGMASLPGQLPYFAGLQEGLAGLGSVGL